MQEERSLYFSKSCLEKADELEPRFVAIHRAHLADEVGHVGWDGELLDWLWPRTGRTMRRVNVRLLEWMIGEFFLLPKRSGVRVVAQLAREFSHLDSAALRRALSGFEKQCRLPALALLARDDSAHLCALRCASGIRVAYADAARIRFRSSMKSFAIPARSESRHRRGATGRDAGDFMGRGSGDELVERGRARARLRHRDEFRLCHAARGRARHAASQAAR